jgi:glycine/D-amino acid oxidase-like deaminating enzyme
VVSTFSPTSNPIGQPEVFAPGIDKGSPLVVSGAGAFGGWTALFLLRAGYRVTLLDPWGAGNSRSSSGDETRVIRSTYGANELYFDLNVRALELWKTHQEAWGRQLFHPTGVLWFCYEEYAEMIEASAAFAAKHGVEYVRFSREEAAKRYPQVFLDDLHHVVLDPSGGYLKAREGAMAVQEAFVREGGTYLQAMAQPGTMRAGKLEEVLLQDGTRLEAAAFVFACGSWLGQLFPELLGEFITCTRQEAYYIGVPAAYSRLFDQMPVWIDLDGSDYYYGIPGNASRGFKIGVDRRGARFDPTHGDRILDPDVLAHARQFLQHRFPILKGAPLAENRVCHYGNSPDGNFLLDQHPDAANCWLLGGGSGHGYKHGPALGEKAAGIVSGAQPMEPAFLLKRTDASRGISK